MSQTIPTSSIPDILPILSGKGGVGKSSVTVQLALSLCRAGHSVGVLDIDLTGPSIPRLFGVEGRKVKQAPGGWLPVCVHEGQDVDVGAEEGRARVGEYGIENGVEGARQETMQTQQDGGSSTPTSNPPQPPTSTPTSTSNPPTTTAQSPSISPARKKFGSLHTMSLAFLLSSRSNAVIWRGPKKTAMVGQLLSEVLWPRDVEYLLIDTPPGTSDEHISLMTNLLDPVKFPPPLASPSPVQGQGQGRGQERRLGAVVVTTPQAISTSDVRKELTFCKKVGLPVLGVVENMAGYVCPCCGEVTNVFSKGGGEVMAREWGVRFLGSVPLDGEGWGMLVEEGVWPVYGGVGEGVASEGERKITRTARDDKAPMVVKYGACSLAPIFEKMVGMLEGNQGALPEFKGEAG